MVAPRLHAVTGGVIWELFSWKEKYFKLSELFSKAKDNKLPQYQPYDIWLKPLPSMLSHLFLLSQIETSHN